jgi:DNA mismatch endonuclease (patch repair protein)
MSAVKNRNTKPEKAVRSLLHMHGFRFRIHEKSLPGNPDIVLPKYKTIIFVHGCFWHQHKGCRKAALPSTSREFWQEKLSANVKRDELNIGLLKDLGWKVKVIWECQISELNQMTNFLHAIKKNEK